MLHSVYRNHYYHSRLAQDVTPTVRTTVYGIDGNSDTYITNKESVTTIPVFEQIASKFIDLSDVSVAIAEDGTETPIYGGGTDGNLLYHSRNYIKVGGTGTEIYRGVVLLNPESFFTAAVASLQGYTTGSPYTIGNATLTLTRSSGTTGGLLRAFLLPLNTTTDSSVTWAKPSEPPQPNGAWVAGTQNLPLFK